MIMLTQLYAICLLVENLEKSLVFYRDTLQLVVNSNDDGYIDFKLGDILYAIFQKNKATSMFPKEHMNSGGSCVIAFQVEDVNESYQKLKGKGVNFLEEPKKMPWGQTVAYFKDPDGNILELTS